MIIPPYANDGLALAHRKVLLEKWRSNKMPWHEVWKILYNIGFRGKELNHIFLPKT